MRIDFALAEENEKKCSTAESRRQTQQIIIIKRKRLDWPGNAFGINDKFMEISFALFTQSTH
jgi:hypothetical protein